MEPTARLTKLQLLLRSISGLSLVAAITSLALVTTSLRAASAAVDANHRGLTGFWHQPAKVGQGVVLEIYPNAVAPGVAFVQGGWATFEWFSPHDFAVGTLPAETWPTLSGAGPYWAGQCGYWDGCLPIGGPRWYTFGGNAPAGPSASSLTLYQTVGGKFNDPAGTSSSAVGTVALTFDSCTSATMEYTFSDGTSRHGSMSLVRLMPDVACSTGAGTLAKADFGYSGNWFDPKTSGQGFVFELNPNAGLLFLTWYTYTSEDDYRGGAAQRWYAGAADYTPGTRTFPVALYEIMGGLFDSVKPPAWIDAVGTATVTFLSCDAAEFAFTFTGGSNADRTGTISLSRVGPTPADCGP